MNFLETCKLAITTLSPIHIGCGEDYEPTNYVIDGRRLYTFDPVLLLRELSQKDRDEFARIVDKPDSLRPIQKFFYDHKNTAVQIGRLNADVVEAAQAFYDTRVGQVAQREQGGENVLNKLEIVRTAFNPLTGQPILPGSSLKGAIRTAVLESLRGCQGFRNTREMEKEILGGSFATDPFRFLKIGDAAFRPKYKSKGQDGVIKETERRPRIRFQVNRKKRPNKYEAGGNINTLVECVPKKLSFAKNHSGGNINTLVECVPGSTPDAFMTTWSVEQKAGLGGQTPSLQLDFATIAKACNHFYLARFQAESSILKTNKYAVKWLADVEKWVGPGGFLKKWSDQGQGFLLRVGRHSGAESVTVNAPRSIKIMKGKNERPEYKEAATTLWLAADNKDQMENLQPFGWVFVRRTT